MHYIASTNCNGIHLQNLIKANRFMYGIIEIFVSFAKMEVDYFQGFWVIGNEYKNRDSVFSRTLRAGFISSLHHERLT